MVYNSKQNKSKTMYPIVDSKNYKLIQNTHISQTQTKFKHYNYVLIEHLLLFNAQRQHASFDINPETDKQTRDTTKQKTKQRQKNNHFVLYLACFNNEARIPLIQHKINSWTKSIKS